MDSTALALTLAGFGMLLLALSYQRHRLRRDVSALLHGVSGALLFLSGSLLFSVALNFNTYAELRAGAPLAEITVEKSGNNTYLLRLLRIPAGDLQVFTLQGERWDIQARLLHWHGWADWLGLRDNIRLEQLNSISQHKTKSINTNGYTNSYELSGNPGVDIWAARQRHPVRFGALQTQALKTDSLPLQGGARFHLYWQDDALVARQINTPGRRSSAGIATPSVQLTDFMDELSRQSTAQADPDAANEAGAETSEAPSANASPDGSTVTTVEQSSSPPN